MGIEAYTDGSVRRLPYIYDRFASWSFVIIDCKQLHSGVVCWDNGLVCLDPQDKHFLGALHYSSNTAELSGLFWCATCLRRLKVKQAVIYSDSQYAVNVLNGERRPRVNIELIRQVRLRTIGYSLRWIKGHAGNKFNEIADALASAALW